MARTDVFTRFEKKITPFPEIKPRPHAPTFAGFVWQMSQGARGLIFSMALLTAAVGVFEALLFWVLGKAVDWVNQTPPQLFWENHGQALALIGLVILLSPLLVLAQALTKYQGIMGNFPMRLRWRFHQYLLEQSLSFFQDDFAGRLSAKVMQTALSVRDFINTVTDILVFVSLYFLTMLVIVAQFDSWLVLPFLIWLALYILVIRLMVPKLTQASQDQADARAVMVGRITDAYTNITTIKLFAHAEKEARYARHAMREFLGVTYQQMRLVSKLELINHSLSMALILGMMGLSLWLWSQGQISAGAIAAASAMAIRLNGMAHWIMWEMASLFEHVGTIKDGLKTFSQPIAIQDQHQATQLLVQQGHIQFQNVSFAYLPNHPIIQHLNLDIRAGEKVGIVGPSGAGKSTLIQLLLRFYDIQQGRIQIDDQNIQTITQHSLRQQIGMVTQDTALLHRSVKDNLCYGTEHTDPHTMHHAAEEAHVHRFIDQLQDAQGRHGYEAHVGERGVKLSGGQRQRIALARVILKNAPILILDEATSALDSEVEAAIQDNMQQLMQGKTVIAIAHRLSTIMHMDRLIVLDKGQIVEEGAHQALLEKQGLYARLWAHQSGGFLGQN